MRITDGKQLARRIFSRTLEGLDVASSVAGHIRFVQGVLQCGDWEFGLQNVPDIRLIAVGKAAHGMVDGLFSVLPAGVPLRGLVSAPGPPRRAHAGLAYFEGGHPAPNASSVAAGKAALDLLEGCSEETLVIVLLSGGGSALMEKLLAPGASLADLQGLNRALVTCGASISEINAIRKHVSAIKGGRLALKAYPAKVLTLAISDVPVGQESALASGPTLPDPTSSQSVRQIIAKYDLRNRIPAPLDRWLEGSSLPETPKTNHVAFVRCNFQLVLGMHQLFHTAHRIAESEDFFSHCDNSTDDWPVRQAADALLLQLDRLVEANPRKNVALIADGELSSAVTGTGVGGRNSAFVLACVEQIVGRPIVVLSAGTDGIDGNSPAAGAIADGETLRRANQAGLNPAEYFRASDSFSFFDALGDTIVTGPTGNNLRDLRLLLFLAH